MNVEASAVLSMLQHDGRCRVLQCCIKRPHSARQIIEATGVPPVTAYRHINDLVSAGLLKVARSAFTPEGRPYDLYASTLEWARLAVGKDGVKVQWRARGEMKDRLHRLWSQLEDPS